jgi:NADPH-dependent 2,4-dienoyl-CoA reductase/sulfur reductase-like enzyme
MADSNAPALPDLRRGVDVGDLKDGAMLVGRVDDAEVLLVRSEGALFAVGAHCTHYRGPLVEGLIVGQTVRCPWHHACFDLKTGAAARPPALDPVECWRVERQGDTVFVTEKLPPAPEAPAATNAAAAPESVVILGGGGAGLAAADTLRREGYAGPITMISADDAPPTDRPNLSKDYLAGQAQDDWIPLRSDEYYAEHRIELLLNSKVDAIDAVAREVRLATGERRAFGALLIATGAEPVHLPVPGADASQVYYLRSFSDSRAIVARAAEARQVIVSGASFIGLEVAASLRARGLEVHVVAPEQVPFERVLGADAGRFIRALHESHGVVFHLGEKVARMDGRVVTLSGGGTVDADFLVMGIGVRPAIGLAEQAGLTIDRGIVVDAYLETSAPGIFAAGDVARWPDARTGQTLRVEHWVVAERQGQTAARNMLGRRERYDAVPFFWSQHYDVTLNYVGHAETWDAIQVDGSLEARDCTLTYVLGGVTQAVVTIARDRESLEAERAMEPRTPK